MKCPSKPDIAARPASCGNGWKGGESSDRSGSEGSDRGCDELGVSRKESKGDGDSGGTGEWRCECGAPIPIPIPVPIPAAPVLAPVVVWPIVWRCCCWCCWCWRLVVSDGGLMSFISSDADVDWRDMA